MKTRRSLSKNAFMPILLALLCVWSGIAHADIYYTVSNYSSGSIGTIRTSGTSMTVNKNLVNNLGRDAFGYTFVDPAGDPVALLREYEYGPNDHVMLFDPYVPKNNWKPFYDDRFGVSNIHGVCSGGQYLYLNTYESYASSGSSIQLPGELVRIDMKNGYKIDKQIRMEEFTKDGWRWHPHGEGVMAIGDYIYVLWSISSHPMPLYYQPSELWKMTKDLDFVEKAYVGKNVGNLSSGNTAFYNGKIYVAAMGGWQGPGTWGDLYEVDVDTMVSTKVLDGHDIVIYKNAAGDRAAVGMYGITVAPDGTAFVLGGSYDGNFEVEYSNFYAGIYRTNVERLSRGDHGTAIAEFNDAGYSWSIMYDKFSDVLWAMTGKKIQAYSRNGSLLREFQPNELGDNIYSVSIIGGGGHTPWTHTSHPEPGEPNPDPDPDPTSDPNPIDHDDEGETAVMIPVDKGLGTADEIMSARVFAPKMSTETANTIKDGMQTGGTPISLADVSGAKVSASRQDASDLLGAESDGNVSSLYMQATVGLAGAVVFRPSFILGERSNTLAGDAVVVPSTVDAFAESLRFRFALVGGAMFDIGEDDYPGLLILGSSSSSEQRGDAVSTVVTTRATIVLVDGPSPVIGNQDGVGVRLDGKYLYIYDGVLDGRVELVTAIVAKGSSGTTPDPDLIPNPGPSDGGAGGGGCTGFDLRILTAALSFLYIYRRVLAKAGK